MVAALDVAARAHRHRESVPRAPQRLHRRLWSLSSEALPMTLILPHETALAREVRRQMSKNIAWFTQHYFVDEDGAKFKLKPFHVELLETVADERRERVILLEPASFGKSTHVAKHYVLWLVAWNPNCQILLGSKNSNDAADRLGVVKAEMEHNEEFINDFGPFVSKNKWRDDEIEVAQRTVNVKDPTIGVFGAGSSIMGKRATHVIGDDLVVMENSGPHVEEATRANVAQKYNDGIKKVGYPGKPLYIRLVNTVVDTRDLIHDLSAKDGAVPEDSAVTNWVSDKRYHVIRRAALDKTTMTSLWPERRSVASLLEEEAEDTMSFLRRMQNLCLDPSNLNFRREWFTGDPNQTDLPGCLDYGRPLLVQPQLEGIAVARTAGYDPNSGLSDDAKYCAYAEVMFDRKSADPRTYWITDIARFRMTLPDQESFCMERARERNLALFHIEDNAANQWLLQLPGLKGMMLSGYRIEGHNTNVKNKYEKETGVPAMAGRIKGGKIRFPYGDVAGRKMTDLAMAEFLSYPQGATTDIIMAIWMAILAAEKVARRSNASIIQRTISPFLTRHGINAEGLDRFYPPRKVS
jgi:hypothetical protein